jgi:hypothetical protein
MPTPDQTAAHQKQINFAAIETDSTVRCAPLLGGGFVTRPRSLQLVTKLNHTALVGVHLCQMEGDVSIEFLEEPDPITNQNRQDRIANFIG